MCSFVYSNDFLEINYLDLNALDSVVEEVVVDFVDYNLVVLLGINEEEPLIGSKLALVRTRYLPEVEYFEDWDSVRIRIQYRCTFCHNTKFCKCKQEHSF